MRGKLPFADKIPAELRKDLTTRTYTPNSARVRPRCADGYCPFGVILATLPNNDYADAFRKEPPASIIIHLLREHGMLDLDNPRHSRAVLLFINAWDAGKIKNSELPRIFGVEENA